MPATEEEKASPARRAWMVRGTNIDGHNLAPDWLSCGFVSLRAFRRAVNWQDPSHLVDVSGLLVGSRAAAEPVVRRGAQAGDLLRAARNGEDIPRQGACAAGS